MAEEPDQSGLWAEAGYSEDFQQDRGWVEPAGSPGLGVILLGLVLGAVAIGLFYVFKSPV